ncbi:MAG: hypothetical protein HY369_04745 [Candidatus Aenigmarchaeota archaeon]|nr:hypothetical protein [Candidatus Aenigmarchaeota archaeon]
MDDLHFMTDQDMIRRIAGYTQPGDTVLEIGGGHGELTAALQQRARRVIVIEKRQDLARGLQARFAGNPRVTVIAGNALREIRHVRFDALIANLPYAISEPLFRLLPGLDFREAVVTLPAGFAEKLQALPYAAWFAAEVVADVPKTAFSPSPRTRSVLVQATPRTTVLGAVLLQKRSKVKNAIREALQSATKRQGRALVADLGLGRLADLQVSNLGPADIATLAQLLESVGPPAAGRRPTFKYGREQ